MTVEELDDLATRVARLRAWRTRLSSHRDAIQMLRDLASLSAAEPLPSVHEVILEALQDHAPLVRRVAMAAALGHVAHSTVLLEHMQLLAVADPDAQCQATAAHVLGEALGPTATVQA